MMDEVPHAIAGPTKSIALTKKNVSIRYLYSYFFLTAVGLLEDDKAEFKFSNTVCLIL